MLKNHDRVAAVVMFVGTVLLFRHADTFPEEVALYPRLVIGLMVILSILMFLKSFTKAERQKAFEPFFIHRKRFLLCAVMMLSYIAGVQYLGFYSATLIFVPVAAFALGYRKRRVMVVAALSYLLFIFLVFGQLFDRPFTTEFFLRDYSAAETGRTIVFNTNRHTEKQDTAP